MGWTHVPPVGHTSDAPDFIQKAAWQEVVDAINERSQFLGLGDLATDIPNCTPAADGRATQLRLSMLAELRDAIETLAPSFRAGVGGAGEAWDLSILLNYAWGVSSWPVVAGGDRVTTGHINVFRACLNALCWIGIVPDISTKQIRYGLGESALWATAWTNCDADYTDGGEVGDDFFQVTGWRGLTGLVLAVNTDADGWLYVEISSGAHWRADIYMDAALLSLVAHVDNIDPQGALAITADNSSGLGGTLTFAVAGFPPPPEYHADTLSCKVLDAYAGDRLLGMLGEAHVLAGPIYQNILTHHSCQDLQFTTPNPTQDFSAGQLRFLGQYEGRHTPWRIYEGASFAGSYAGSSYLAEGWGTLDLPGAPAKNSEVHYSLRPEPEEPTRSNYNPSDVDGALKGSYMDDCELLVKIAFELGS